MNAPIEFLAIVLLVLLFGGGFLYLFLRLLTAWERRRVAEEVVLGHVASALKQNLPLAQTLALACRAEEGAARLHLRRVSTLLSQGAPLSMALREGFPDCSALAITLISAGEQEGQVMRAAEIAERLASHRHRLLRSAPGMPLVYFVIVALCTLSMAAFMMVAVVPKFKEIFRDFGAELPAITRFVFTFADEFSELIAVSLLASLLLVPMFLYLSYRPRNPVKLSWISRLADELRWWMPWTRRVYRHQGMAAVMETMRCMVEAGGTLEDAARLASKVDSNVHVQRAVRSFASKLSAGEPAGLAANSCGLGEVASVALGSGPRHGNLDAGLRYAADYHTAMYTRGLVITARMMTPVFTMVVALLAAVVVLAMFLPLVTLINSTSGGA